MSKIEEGLYYSESHTNTLKLKAMRLILALLIMHNTSWEAWYMSTCPM